MSAFVGVAGSLVEVHGGSSLRTADEKSQTILTALGGRRTAQMGAESRRTWDCSIENGDSAALSRLSVLRLAVPMPWVFYSAWATVTNILTPDHSVWRGRTYTGATIGGLVDLADGGLAVALNETNTSRQVTVNYPVSPGMTVTVGTFMRQRTAGTSTTLRLTWADAAGAVLTSVSTTKATALFGPLERVTVTGVAPAGAASFYAVAGNASVLAAPSATFTDKAMPWAVGAGCLTATVAGISSDALAAWPEVGGQRASYSFTVTEVG